MTGFCTRSWWIPWHFLSFLIEILENRCLRLGRRKEEETRLHCLSNCLSSLTAAITLSIMSCGISFGFAICASVQLRLLFMTSLGPDACLQWNPQKLGNFKLHANAELLPNKRHRQFCLLTAWFLRILSDNEGHLVVCRLLCSHLPHDLLLLVVKTGGGKTGLFYGCIRTPSTCIKRSRLYVSSPKAEISAKSCYNCLYPTKGLKEEIVSFRHFLMALI